MYKYILIIILIATLTGCKSKEPEDRDFVMVMGIDKDENCIVYADIANLNSNSGDIEIKDNIVLGEGNTINNAIDKINKKVEGDLFLGHVQTMLVTNDNSKSEIINLVRNNMEIGRDIPIIKCEDIETIMGYKDDNTDLQEYVSRYFKNNKHKKINIETYLNKYEDNNDLPTITIKDNKYNIE